MGFVDSAELEGYGALLNRLLLQLHSKKYF